MTPTRPSRDQSNQRSSQLAQLLARRWTLAVLGQLLAVASDTKTSTTASGESLTKS